MRKGACTVLLPYYNESGFIGETLRSLLRQTRLPDQIILVDNASTDGSESVCRQVVEEAGYRDCVFLREEKPGKIYALEAGSRLVEGEFVATCDADILYPPHYLELAIGLFRSSTPRIVAVMGQYLERRPDDLETRKQLRKTVALSKIFTGKCFAGGAGQTFRTETLLKAGGFSADIWEYVLLDHEIMHRVLKYGRSLYHEDLWILHTNRRSDRSRVRWTLWDRLLYRYTPHLLGDWYFYRYLAPRFARRKMHQLNLRHQPWTQSAPPAGG